MYDYDTRKQSIWQGGRELRNRKRRVVLIGALTAALLMVVGGILMLGRTFAHYNDLSLRRQDVQLQEMVSAADHYISVQLKNFRADLAYVLGRRGFIQAEEEWRATGETEQLLYRMQENLISQDPLIQTMLAIKDGQIFLSTDGRVGYRFVSEMEGDVQPCFAGDGTMYIAVIERTAHATYAALIHAERWYASLAQVSEYEGNRLLLLGMQGKILLHQWHGETHVTAVEDLNAHNCDLEAVRLMTKSRIRRIAIFDSYHLADPIDNITHEMRMMVIPVEQSTNGYFIVGLTSEYDEIIVPMQNAAIQLIFYGGVVIGGVLLLAAILVLRSIRHSRELRTLELRNEEMQTLLDRTQELAHHQRLETIGTLTASIAHEFNNLLTPIMGYSILTLEGLPMECDELAENVTEIYEASRKAKTIISRLSDLSRKNSENTFQPLVLADTVEKALEVAAPAQPPHVTTSVRRECGRCCISGNETQMNQLLLNLILNAFHAMEASGGVLTLTVEQEAENVLLRVADTGVGIPAEVLPHVFEPFFTTKGPGRGTGLGLAIVQQVVESHSGTIEVASIPGEGTTFTLRFQLLDHAETRES